MVCNTLSKAFIYLKVTLAGCSGFGWLVAVGRTFSEGFCLQSRNKKLVIRSRPQDRVVSGQSLPGKLDFSEIYLAICLFLVFYSSVYTFFYLSPWLGQLRSQRSYIVIIIIIIRVLPSWPILKCPLYNKWVLGVW